MNSNNKSTNKIPIHKKWWFWAIIAFLGISLIYGAFNPSDTTQNINKEAEEAVENVVEKEEATPKEKTIEQVLSETLSPTNAQSACNQYGDKMYPYGFKMHSITGKLAEEAKDEHTWFFKFLVDITNANGATAKNQNMECSVTGTSQNPEVIQFLVY